MKFMSFVIERKKKKKTILTADYFRILYKKLI